MQSIARNCSFVYVATSSFSVYFSLCSSSFSLCTSFSTIPPLSISYYYSLLLPSPLFPQLPLSSLLFQPLPSSPLPVRHFSIHSFSTPRSLLLLLLLSISHPSCVPFSEGRLTVEILLERIVRHHLPCYSSLIVTVIERLSESKGKILWVGGLEERRRWRRR